MKKNLFVYLDHEILPTAENEKRFKNSKLKNFCFKYIFKYYSAKYNIYILPRDRKQAHRLHFVYNINYDNIISDKERLNSMKFDKGIINPPYDGNLHLKVIEEILKNLNENGELVSLSPIRWLQDPFAKEKKTSDFNKFNNVFRHIKSVCEITKQDAERYFGSIRLSTDLGIITIDTKLHDNDFINQLFCKCYSKIKDNLCTIDHNKKDGWRIKISKVSNSHTGKQDNQFNNLRYFYNGEKDGKKWFEYYGKNQWSKTTDEITYSIKVDSEIEAINFVNSFKTTFGRWYTIHALTDMNTTNKTILWLPSYKQKWTDKKLYKFFNLTEEEIHSIENEMKQYEASKTNKN